jgi:hypothetical protein
VVPPAPRWWLALVGLFGIAAGILTFAWPGITALVLLLFIAGWAIATGVSQIVGAIRLRKEIENEWLLIASGVLSVIFGLILVAQPGTGALALLYVIGIYAVLYGILEVWLSLRLRGYVWVLLWLPLRVTCSVADQSCRYHAPETACSDNLGTDGQGRVRAEVVARSRQDLLRAQRSAPCTGR